MTAAIVCHLGPPHSTEAGEAPCRQTPTKDHTMASTQSRLLPALMIGVGLVVAYVDGGRGETVGSALRSMTGQGASELGVQAWAAR